MKRFLSLKPIVKLTASFIFVLMFVAAMAVAILLAGLPETSNASDLYVSQKGKLGFIGTSESCVVVTFVSDKTYAPDKPVKRDIAAKKYNWKIRTTAEKSGCNDIKKAATQIKVYKVAVNPRYPNNKTRPVKNVIDFAAGVLGRTVKQVRADIGLTCGKLIKTINKRYSWRAVLINNSTFAVVCE